MGVGCPLVVAVVEGKVVGFIVDAVVLALPVVACMVVGSFVVDVVLAEGVVTLPEVVTFPEGQ